MLDAHAGQDISSIIARKKLERCAGNGLFFWGIGNAPSRSIRRLAAKGENIDVVFSLMKSRPKNRDLAPGSVLAWTTYFDLHEVERPLPPHVLVTSGMDLGSGAKSAHYALMYCSKESLWLGDFGPFDPSAYRNIGDAGGPVSSSQVTALIVGTGDESPKSDYRVNLRAKLFGSYWVRLAKPCILRETGVRAFKTTAGRVTRISAEGWIGIVSDIRSLAPSAIEEQPYLF